MEVSKFGKELENMKKAWTQSEKDYDYTFGGESVPDAVYLMKVQDLKLRKTKAKKLYVAREWLIVKGEHKGVPVRDMLHLGTDKGFVYLRQFIMMMGYKCPSSPAKIEDVLSQIKKDAKLIKASVSHSHTATGDFTNVRVNQLVKESTMSQDYDLDDLDEKGLKKLIKKEELDVDPDDFEDDEDGLREAVKDALEDLKDDDDDDDDIDPDEMDEDEIREYVKDNDLDIEDDLGFEDKKEYKSADEDDLKKALAKYLKKKGKSSGKKKAPDFDEMEEEELRDFVKDNDLDIEDDLGFEDKKEYKSADEDDLKKALAKWSKKSKKSDDDDDDEKEKKEKGKKKKKSKGSDDLLERAKTFCGAWDIKVDDDEEDIKAIKKLIAKDGKDDAEYPADELDDDEKELLEELGLEECIKKGKGKKGKK
jgi:hypothetical protein